MKRISLYIAAVLVALAITSMQQVEAVESGGVGGKPAYPKENNPRTNSIFIYELKPGETASDGVRIFNNTSEKQSVSVYPVDSELSSGGAFACKQAADKNDGVGSWIKLDNDKVEIAPNDSTVVPFTVTVPSTVEVGEHNGCIAMQAASQTATTTDTGGVQLSFRSAIRVAVNVPGVIVKKITIEGVALKAADDGKYLLVPTVRNDGNVSVDATVTAKLVSLFGTSIPSSAGDYPILPGSTATWNFEVAKPFWGGFYKADVRIAYNDNPSDRLGVKTSSKPKSISRSSGFVFVAPQPAAALVELLVALVAFGVVWLLIQKFLHKHHVKRHWGAYTVKNGETLDQLADRHDISWKRIANANSLKAPYVLREGQKIKLPSKKG